MSLSPVSAAPPSYALGPGATPRPDLMQSAGTLALAVAAPSMVPQAPVYDRDYLARRIEQFEAAEDASKTNREKAERDIDYYDGRQWTEKEAAELRRRGQPVISLNLVRQKIDFLQGLERTQRTKPKALPRTPQHEDDAHAAGDALVYIADDNRYDQTRSRTWGDLLKAGWGGVECTAEPVPVASPGAPQMRVGLRRCQWDRMFWDPYSAEEDFSDASYLGMVLWMDRDEAIRTYGDDAGKVYDETVSGAEVGGTFDDKPKITTWVMHGKRRRVRIVQMYHIGFDGEWSFCEFTKGGILKAGPSPWLNEFGQREHPYIWRSSYVDRDNNRYGAIRDLIDPQDESNKRRSKALHHFTARQTFGTPEAQGGMSIRDLRQQLARPDGHLQLPSNAKWGENFGIIPTNDQAAGHFELLQQAMSVFEIMGPNAAMQGKGSKDQSGRAILAQQQGGSVQMGTLTDTLRDMDAEVFRKAWNRVRQFWTAETWVRVTDDEQNLKWVGLNAPSVQEVQNPMTGEVVTVPVVDPATGQAVLRSPVAELDVDIIIDDAPDMGTLQNEQFEQLVALKQMDANGEIPFRAIIAAAPGLRGKSEMLKAMDERAQTAQQPNPMALMGAQAEMENLQADTANKAASARKSEAQAATMLSDAQLRAAQVGAAQMMGAM